jgi:hypothetical protein
MEITPWRIRTYGVSRVMDLALAYLVGKEKVRSDGGRHGSNRGVLGLHFWG